MGVIERLMRIEERMNPDVNPALVLEFWTLKRVDRKAFEHNGIGELYDRYHKAKAIEPDRNIDLIDELYTTEEEKRIMQLFIKQQTKKRK